MVGALKVGSNAKRSKSNTSTDVSDARINIDLNDDNDDVDIGDDDTQGFPDIDPLPRPIGRDQDRSEGKSRKGEKARKAAASSQQSSTTLDYITKRLDDHLELQKERMELKKRHQEFIEQQEAARRGQEERMRDLDILKMDPDAFVGENREAFLAMQQQIREKYM